MCFQAQTISWQILIHLLTLLTPLWDHGKAKATWRVSDQSIRGLKTQLRSLASFLVKPWSIGGERARCSLLSRRVATRSARDSLCDSPMHYLNKRKYVKSFVVTELLGRNRTLISRLTIFFRFRALSSTSLHLSIWFRVLTELTADEATDSLSTVLNWRENWESRGLVSCGLYLVNMLCCREMLVWFSIVVFG